MSFGLGKVMSGRMINGMDSWEWERSVWFEIEVVQESGIRCEENSDSFEIDLVPKEIKYRYFYYFN